MKIKTTAIAGLFALGTMTATAAHAQGATATASNPEGLVALLQQAGYEPTLGKDDLGDPKIDIKLSGYETAIFFYGCDEETHTGCTSLQFQIGFDRETPWTAAEALKLSQTYRFASVWLDDENDPWVQWDVVTGDGIPAKVFLESVTMFGDTVEDASEVIFAGDE